jgi:hypothetical protein
MSKTRFLVGWLLTSLALATASGEDFEGESIVLLNAGKKPHISYSLYQVGDRTEEDDFDLLLVLRNVGAKWIPLDDVSTKHITIKDAKGHKIDCALITTPSTIPYGRVTVGQILVLQANAPAPWSLTFDSGDNEIIRVQFQLTDIRLRDDARKSNRPDLPIPGRPAFPIPGRGNR